MKLMDVEQLTKIGVTIFFFGIGFYLLLLRKIPIKKERIIDAIKQKRINDKVIRKYKLAIHFSLPLGIAGILICLSVIWYIILTSGNFYTISSVCDLLFPVSLLCGAVGVYVFSSRFISLLSKIYEVEKT